MATSVALKQVSDRVAALRETELQGIPEEAAGEPEPEFAPAPAPTTVATPVPHEARRFWSGQLMDRSGAIRRLSRFLITGEAEPLSFMGSGGYLGVNCRPACPTTHRV